MNKKDKNKKDLSVWGTIAVVFALLSSFSDIMDESAFVILVAVAVFIVIAVALAKAAKKGVFAGKLRTRLSAEDYDSLQKDFDALCAARAELR